MFTWCVTKIHPLVVQVSEKYNISRDDARTILNNARANDVELQNDDISLDFLESKEAFQKALQAYNENFLNADDFLFMHNPTEDKSVEDWRNELREEFGEISEDDVEEMMGRKDEIGRNANLSKVNTSDLAHLLRTFKDTRRLEFLGDWICRNISEMVTIFETADSIREKYKIDKKEKRVDYFRDNKVIAVVWKKIQIMLLKQAASLQKEGDMQRALELAAAKEYFNSILYMYGANLFRDEGVAINPDGLPTFPKLDMSDDVVNETSNDEEDDEDVSESKVDGFSSSEQHKSVTTKIVPTIKILLSNIRNVNAKGNEVVDRYGYGLHTYISVQDATNKLLKLCHKCTSFSEMMQSLKTNERSAPWMNQLIKALDTSYDKDMSGEVDQSKSKKEQLQSMFFKSFRKQFINMGTMYSIYDADGNILFINKDTNVHHRADKMLRQVRTMYGNMTGSRIFKTELVKGNPVKKGIDFNEVATLSLQLTGSNSVSSKIADAISSAKKSARTATLNKESANYGDAYALLDEASKSLLGILENLGIQADEDMMNDYLVNDPDGTASTSIFGEYSKVEDPELSVRANRMNTLVEYTNRILANLSAWGVAQQKGATNDTPLTNPFALRKDVRSDYDKINYIRNWYRNTVNLLAEFSPDSYENRARINGKDYYSWNNPSSILTTIQKLTDQNRDKVRAYIENKYGKDTLWFVRPNRKKETGLHFYSDWLDDIYNGNGRNILDYSEKPSINENSYEEVSDLEYGLSMLFDYFSDPEQKTAKYRMLISSDKPRYSLIKFKRYSDRSIDNGMETENNYHTVITTKATEFFAQEIRRSIDVVNRVFSDNVKVDDYDIKINDKNKIIFDKIKNGEKVTLRDVLDDNGKYIFRETGASFYLNKFIIKEIEKNTRLGRSVVDRIFNSKLHKGELVVTPTMISDFKDGFRSYMNSIVDGTIRYYDKIGMLESKTKFGEKKEDNEEHLKFLLSGMFSWHTADNELHTMYGNHEAASAVANFFGFDYNAMNNGAKIYFQEVAAFRNDLEEFVYNNWLAKANMSEIFDVDLAFYKNTPNFQKRNAQVISSGYEINPDARIHEELVSDGIYRSITIKTNKIMSQHIQNIQSALEKRAATITDPLKKKQFDRGIKYTINELKKFDSTDGQSFTSLTALRKRMAGLGEWSRSSTSEMDDDVNTFTDEAIYRRMRKGQPRTEDFLHVFAQPQKPFVYSMTQLQGGDRSITVPTQHKNSEYALAYLTAFVAHREANEQPKSVIEAIAWFLEESADDKNKDRGIDNANFDSTVKIGNNSATVDLNDLNGQQALEALRMAAYDTTEFDKAPRDKNGKLIYKNGAVTEYDASDYRIVQEKPEHFKSGFQPMGSQLKILAINNIHDNEMITLPNGSQIDGKTLKRRYFAALRKKMKSTESKFRKEFGLNMPAEYRIHKLSRELKKAMSTDQKFGPEMRRALSVITRDGENQFTLPLDEPGTQSAVEAMLYSKIRSVYYKEKTRGGIVIQATSWGASDELAIRFYSSDPKDIARDGLLRTKRMFAADEKLSGEELDAKYKEYCDNYQEGYAHFEAEIPMPDHVRRMISNPDGSIDAKYFNANGTWNMDEIKKVVPEKYFEAICYRLPTEAKYSVMVCKIVRFSPEFSGSVAKYPLDLTTFTGSDFDIDTDTIEIRPEEQQKNKDVDNEIFDLQLAALRAHGSLQETFKPGDFSDLSELSYYVTLLEKGYSPEELDKMDFKTLKKNCELEEDEDLDLMNPVTDIILHNQNSDAGGMIAIAAVGVTSHAFLSLYNDIDETNPGRDPKTDTNRTNFVTLDVHVGDGKKVNESFTVVNDKEGEENTTSMFVGGKAILDPMFDMDGKLVSTEISKYVGASADAAKDAALYRLNITKRTLPILILMHRLGISSDVARLFIRQPVFKEFTRIANNMTATGSSGTDAVLSELVYDYLYEKHKNDGEFEGIYPDNPQARQNEIMDRIEKAYEDLKHQTDVSLVYSELFDDIKEEAGKEQKQQSLGNELKLVYIFETLDKLQHYVKNLDSFTRYNSSKTMRGTNFLDRHAMRQRLVTLRGSLTGENPRISLPKDVKIMSEFENNEFGRLCSMFPYIGQTIKGEEEMTDKIILDNMHTYSPTFFEFVDRLGISEDASSMKKLYAGWKSYLMFSGDNRIVDFRNKADIMYFTRDFPQVFFGTISEIKENNPQLYNEAIYKNKFIDEVYSNDAKDGYDNFKVLSTDINGLSGPALEKFKNDWEALLNYPETRQLALESAIYFLARSSAYSRDTPTHAIPLAVKEALQVYTNVFVDANKIKMSEKEKTNFLTAVALNNSDDRKLVPHFYQMVRGRQLVDVRREEGKILFNKERSTISSWFKQDENKLTMRVPVISVDDKLYLITDMDVSTTSEEKTDYYVLNVKPVNPLGIPNVMSEYIVTDDMKSAFKQNTEETNDVPQSEEAKITDPNMDEVAQNIPQLRNRIGQRVGTFITVNPFGSDAMDVNIEDALVDNPYRRSNAYLESRTTLKRADKIIKAMGMKLASTQREMMIANDGRKFYSYKLNIIPTKETENFEDEALAVASVLQELGNKKQWCSVSRYINNLSDADSYEFTVGCYVKDIDAINSVMKRYFPGIAYVVNIDRMQNRGEINFKLYTEEMTGTVNGDIVSLGEKIKQIKNIIRTFGNAGIKTARDVEINPVAEHDLYNADEILEQAQNGKQAEKAQTDGGGVGVHPQGSAEGASGAQTREQVGYMDLVELARRKRAGEKVEDEIRQIFGEYSYPLASAGASYESTSLADKVLSSLSTLDSYNQIADVLDLKTSGIKDQQTKTYASEKMLDALIINAANWIIGNRPIDILQKMMENGGLAQGSAESIISTIDQKLKELDIC